MRVGRGPGWGPVLASVAGWVDDALVRAVTELGGTDRALDRRLHRQAVLAAREDARRRRAFTRAVARRERALRRARRALPVDAVAGGCSAVLAVAHLGPHDTLWVVAGGFALHAVRAGSSLRLPPLVPPAPASTPAPPPPPSRSSAAWPAARRLEQARTSVAALLPLVAPAGAEVAREAAGCAAEADTALRWQAARLSAVEVHRGPDPVLLGHLEHGVRAQEALVAALADLVAASADPLAPGRLQDATDALHGLAAGLREVRR